MVVQIDSWPWYPNVNCCVRCWLTAVYPDIADEWARYWYLTRRGCAGKLCVGVDSQLLSCCCSIFLNCRVLLCESHSSCCSRVLQRVFMKLGKTRVESCKVCIISRWPCGCMYVPSFKLFQTGGGTSVHVCACMPVSAARSLCSWLLNHVFTFGNLYGWPLSCKTCRALKEAQASCRQHHSTAEWLLWVAWQLEVCTFTFLLDELRGLTFPSLWISSHCMLPQETHRAKFHQSEWSETSFRRQNVWKWPKIAKQRAQNCRFQKFLPKPREQGLKNSLKTRHHANFKTLVCTAF